MTRKSLQPQNELRLKILFVGQMPARNVDPEQFISLLKKQGHEVQYVTILSYTSHDGFKLAGLEKVRIGGFDLVYVLPTSSYWRPPAQFAELCRLLQKTAFAGVVTLLAWPASPTDVLWRKIKRLEQTKKVRRAVEIMDLRSLTTSFCQYRDVVVPACRGAMASKHLPLFSSSEISGFIIAACIIAVIWIGGGLITGNFLWFMSE